MIKPDIFVLGKSEEYSNLEFNYTYRIPHDKVTRHTFNYIKRVGSSPYFYLVKESANTTIDLEAEVFEHNNAFHLWNGNDAVRLFNREVVLAEPEKYIDEEWHSGTITNVYDIVDTNARAYDTRYQESYNRNQCQTVILTRGWPDWCEQISKLYYPIIHIDSNDLGEQEIAEILEKSKRSYIYIVRDDIKCEGEFQLNWIPAAYDNQYMHVWNNNTNLSMISRTNLAMEPEKFTDFAYNKGEILIKHLEDTSLTIKNRVVSKVDNTIPAEQRSASLHNKDQCQSVILTRGWPEWANTMSSVHHPIIHLDNFELDLAGIDRLITESDKQVFHIIRKEIKTNDQLDYVPPFYDEMFMHIWNNSFDLQTITRAALEKSPAYYTDQAVMNDMTQIKNIDNDNLIIKNQYDIIYLSYDEESSNANFKKLQSRFPRAKRVHGVAGIFAAHQRASLLATTSMFYVVDADAIISDDFNFDYTVSLYDQDCVFVWRSRNPCNGLKYGYGGVKLFPTQKLRDAKTWRIDFTTSVANKFKAMDTVSNITNFNTSAFSAWRSGFREAVKLASSCIKNANDWESQERLETWTTIANDVPFANECRAGAKAGAKYGKEYATNLEKLAKINDFEWLEIQYEYTKND